MPSPRRSWQPVAPSADLPTPAGAYSPAARVGDLVFVSGQVPKDPSTGQVVEGGIREQTRRVLENVRLVLAGAGATLDDVVSVTVYLTNVDDWGAFNDVYKDTFRPSYPARAVVGAELRGILVEVSAVAAAPRA